MPSTVPFTIAHDLTRKGSVRLETRTDRSIRMQLLEQCLKPFRPRLVAPGKPYPAGSPRVKIPQLVQKACHHEERQVEGIYVYDLTAKRPFHPLQDEKSQHRRHRVYYFCGGGWQSPPSSSHWRCLTGMAQKLARSSPTTVTVVSYPLAPNSPAPLCYDQLVKLYRTLLQQSVEADEHVTLAGDSAGGNVVLALTLHVASSSHSQSSTNEDNEHTSESNPLSLIADSSSILLPQSIFAICPSCDMTRENPQIFELAPLDPILSISSITSTARAWQGASTSRLSHTEAWSPRDPRVSPLLAPEHAWRLLVERNVRVHGVTAGYDILSPDAIAWRDRWDEYGGQGRWLHWEKQMHCFPLAIAYGVLPDPNEAFAWICKVLAEEGKREVPASMDTTGEAPIAAGATQRLISAA